MRGFSLFEMLIVLVIIGMASALVGTSLHGGDLARLKADTRELAGILKYTRRHAIISGKTQRVVLRNRPKDGEQGKAEEEAWQARNASFKWHGQGAETTPADTDQGDIHITFYPGGGSSGGEILLKHVEYESEIEIDPITGKLKIHFPGDKTDS